jgi:hypothetical protein
VVIHHLVQEACDLSVASWVYLDPFLERNKPDDGDILIREDFKSESYVTTDGQSARLSWNEAPIWGLRPDYCQSVASFLMWGALLTRGRIYCLQILLALASTVFLRSESLGARGHILLSQV